ncbi:hypothetical protein N7536_005109 [Penicillium majusculum]|nr:hypothetical protein N7536_005109 [Penicillium majusculum]
MATDVRIAQAIGTLGCAVAASGIATLSIMSIPNIILPARRPPSATLPFQDTPGTPTAHLTHQWLDLWSTCYLLAVGVTMSIAPFTVTAMKKTNAKLKAHAKRDDAADAEGTEGMVVSPEEKAKRARDDSEVVELLQHWSQLNLIRAAFPLVGAGIGFYAAVSSWIIP